MDQTLHFVPGTVADLVAEVPSLISPLIGTPELLRTERQHCTLTERRKIDVIHLAAASELKLSWRRTLALLA